MNDIYIGRIFDDRYQVKAVLGQGGMATVYLASQRPMDRDVAIKVLSPEATEDGIAYARFEREMRVVSRLSHPNCVTVFDYGRADDGRPYIVMEYLDGMRLTSVVAHDAPLHPRRAAHIIGQICDALGEAHAKDIVHRDLKTGNVVLIARNGYPDLVKVVDFGLAKIPSIDGHGSLTQAGMVVGTPAYMSPEQVKGDAVDHRSDLYSLGIILYELLTGSPPFVGKSAMGVMVMHVERQVPPLKANAPRLALKPETDQFLEWVLAKKPADRPQSAAELKQQLLAVLGEQTLSEAETAEAERVRTSPHFVAAHSSSEDQPTLQSLQFLPPLGSFNEDSNAAVVHSVQESASDLTIPDGRLGEQRRQQLLPEPAEGADLPPTSKTEPDTVLVSDVATAAAVYPDPISIELSGPFASKATGANNGAHKDMPRAEVEQGTDPESEPESEPDSAQQLESAEKRAEPSHDDAAADADQAVLDAFVATHTGSALSLKSQAEATSSTQKDDNNVAHAPQAQDWLMNSAEFRFFDDEDQAETGALATPSSQSRQHFNEQRSSIGMQAHGVKKRRRFSAAVLVLVTLGGFAFGGIALAYLLVQHKQVEQRGLFVDLLNIGGDDDSVALTKSSAEHAPRQSAVLATDAGAASGADVDASSAFDFSDAQQGMPGLENSDAGDSPDAAVAASDPEGNATLLYRAGMQLIEQGKHRRAIKKFEVAAKLSPRDAKIQLAIGKAWFESGRTRNAVKFYLRAKSLDPDLADVHLMLGLAWHELGELEKAREHYQTYLKLAPEGKEAPAVRDLLTSL